MNPVLDTCLCQVTRLTWSVSPHQINWTSCDRNKAPKTDVRHIHLGSDTSCACVCACVCVRLPQSASWLQQSNVEWWQTHKEELKETFNSLLTIRKQASQPGVLLGFFSSSSFVLPVTPLIFKCLQNVYLTTCSTTLKYSAWEITWSDYINIVGTVWTSTLEGFPRAQMWLLNNDLKVVVEMCLCGSFKNTTFYTGCDAGYMEMPYKCDTNVKASCCTLTADIEVTLYSTILSQIYTTHWMFHLKRNTFLNEIFT